MFSRSSSICCCSSSSASSPHATATNASGNSSRTSPSSAFFTAILPFQRMLCSHARRLALLVHEAHDLLLLRLAKVLLQQGEKDFIFFAQVEREDGLQGVDGAPD